MNGNRWFVAGIIVFLLLMLALEYRLPKEFVWTPTFSHVDKQPLGCALFDSLLSRAMPHSYTLSRKTFYQLEEEDSLYRSGVLVIAEHLSLGQADVDALLKSAARGNRIMLVSNDLGSRLADTLGIRIGYNYYFSPKALKRYAASLSAQRDSICWVGDSARYPRRTFYFYPHLGSSVVYADSLVGEVLAVMNEEAYVARAETAVENEEEEMEVEEVQQAEAQQYLDTICPRPVAFARSWGKGEIIIATTPLLFTNYGVLDGQNAAYLFRLLSRMKGLPLVRTEAYMEETAQVQQSPFRFFLSKPPLRLALYLAMVGILLFMVSTARRKQRAIPVVHEPENRSLEFIKLIGTLYYQQHDPADLVRKKYLYFAETLRREIQVDVEDATADRHSFIRIARKTGMDADEIESVIREVRLVVYGGQTVTMEQMMRYVDRMNEIVYHLGGDSGGVKEGFRS